jgi:hypothetical protein
MINFLALFSFVSCQKRQFFSQCLWQKNILQTITTVPGSKDLQVSEQFTEPLDPAEILPNPTRMSFRCQKMT